MLFRFVDQRAPTYHDACANVRQALEILAAKVQAECASVRPKRFDTKPQNGAKFEGKALKYALAVNQIEEGNTQAIKAAAQEITALCHKDWAQDKNILCLWHQLAQIVTEFSENPDKTKRVATLLINQNGELHTFAANRTPEGLDKHGSHFAKGLRKDFIVCSERIAMARLLNIRLRSFGRFSEWKHESMYKALQIGQLTSDLIRDAIIKRPALKNIYALTTVSPCDVCATAFVVHKPKGVITCEAIPKHFTRANAIKAGKKSSNGPM